MSRRVDLRIWIAVGLMCAIWGSTWLVVREGLDEMPPFGSAGIRFLLAGGVMLFVAPFIARREGGEAPTLDLVAAMATCNFALSYGIVYWSEMTLPSSLVAILWAIYPIFTAVACHFIVPGTRIVGLQWTGLVLGFAGVVALLWTDAQEASRSGLTVGAVLLVSPMVSAVATAYVKRKGAGVSSALLNQRSMLPGGILLCAAAFTVEGGLEAPPSPAAWASVLYLALPGTVLTFSLYFWVLRKASAISLSLISYVTPVIALLLGVFFADEPFTVFTLPGLALILTGCVLVLRRPKSDSPQ